MKNVETDLDDVTGKRIRQIMTDNPPDFFVDSVMESVMALEQKSEAWTKISNWGWFLLIPFGIATFWYLLTLDAVKENLVFYTHFISAAFISLGQYALELFSKLSHFRLSPFIILILAAALTLLVLDGILSWRRSHT